MATHFSNGQVFSASEANQLLQATSQAAEDQAHCLQSGSFSWSMTSGGAVDGTTTFSTAFSSSPNVVLTINAGSSAGAFNTIKVHIRSTSASSFNWRVATVSGTPTTSGTVEWMAFGQIEP